MLQKSKAIAIHSVRYGESSLITYLYSLEKGRVTVMVNKAFGGGKGRSKAVYFQPLTLLNVVYYPGKHHGMGRLKEVSPYELHSNIQFNETKRAVAIFLGELFYRTVREEESNPALFDFMENAIQILDVLEDGVPNFHLVFLVQFSKYLGFYPNGKFSESTPIFDFKNGVYTQSEPSHPLFFNSFNSQLLTKLLQENFTSSAQLSLNHNQRNAFVDLMLIYYSYHMEAVHGMKSLAVLKQVFS